MIGEFDEPLVVYQVSDKYDANLMDHATDLETIRKLHERAIDNADIVVYSGQKLLQEATGDVNVVSAGAGRRFRSLVAGGQATRRCGSSSAYSAAAARVFRRDRAVAGGPGTDQARARERPDWQWIFIGNKSRGVEIEALRNTHFLPPVPYESCRVTPRVLTSACCRGTLRIRLRATVRRSRCANIWRRDSRL